MNIKITREGFIEICDALDRQGIHYTLSRAPADNNTVPPRWDFDVAGTLCGTLGVGEVDAPYEVDIVGIGRLLGAPA